MNVQIDQNAVLPELSCASCTWQGMPIDTRMFGKISGLCPECGGTTVPADYDGQALAAIGACAIACADSHPGLCAAFVGQIAPENVDVLEPSPTVRPAGNATTRKVLESALAAHRARQRQDAQQEANTAVPSGPFEFTLFPYQKVNWNECQRISDLPDVDDALHGFSEDPTGDNATCVVRAILASQPQATPLEATSELEAMMIQRRIAITPEYEGGFLAEKFGDEETASSKGYGATPSEAIAAMKPVEGATSEQEDTDAANEWRRLALQFDGHRMQALAHLRAMIQNPAVHTTIATEFLNAPPLSGNTVLAQRIAEIAAEATSERKPLTDAARDVLAERRRHVEQEGWTPAHDDQYQKQELRLAAICYARADAFAEGTLPAPWPWTAKWWKPGSERRNLVKAGALILADIERMDRVEQHHGIGGGK